MNSMENVWGTASRQRATLLGVGWTLLLTVALLVVVVSVSYGDSISFTGSVPVTIEADRGDSLRVNEYQLVTRIGENYANGLYLVIVGRVLARDEGTACFRDSDFSLRANLRTMGVDAGALAAARPAFGLSSPTSLGVCGEGSSGTGTILVFDLPAESADLFLNVRGRERRIGSLSVVGAATRRPTATVGLATVSSGTQGRGSSSQGESVGLAYARVSLRSGPGESYPVVAVVSEADGIEIVGRSADSNWFEVRAGRLSGWLGRTVVKLPAGLAVERIAVSASAPAAPAVRGGNLGTGGGARAGATNTPRPPAAQPAPPTARAGNCDPAYPTVCIPPPPPDLDCGHIPFRNFRVRPPDSHRFDGDNDGVGLASVVALDFEVKWRVSWFVDCLTEVELIK